MAEVEEVTPAGPARRAVLKRAAVIGGATVWSTPVVQSIAAPALAVGGSPETGGGQDGGEPQVTMEVYVSNPFDPTMPPLRLCKTIAARGADPAQQAANTAELKAIYCPQGNILDAVLHAVSNPAKYEYPRSCTATDVPTTC